MYNEHNKLNTEEILMKLTKRVLALVLSVLMLLSVFAVCASAKAGDRNCSTCPNKMNVIADYSCAEVNEPEKNYVLYYCPKCDKTDRYYVDTPDDHIFVPAKGKEATCTEKGFTAKECSVCHKLVKEETGLKDHIKGDDGYCVNCHLDMLTDRCPYCQQQHGDDFGGRITRFFHNIALFFQNMFNR